MDFSYITEIEEEEEYMDLEGEEGMHEIGIFLKERNENSSQLAETSSCFDTECCKIIIKSDTENSYYYSGSFDEEESGKMSETGKMRYVNEISDELSSSCLTSNENELSPSTVTQESEEPLQLSDRERECESVTQYPRKTAKNAQSKENNVTKETKDSEKEETTKSGEEEMSKECEKKENKKPEAKDDSTNEEETKTKDKKSNNSEDESKESEEENNTKNEKSEESSIKKSDESENSYISQESYNYLQEGESVLSQISSLKESGTSSRCSKRSDKKYLQQSDCYSCISSKRSEKTEKETTECSYISKRSSARSKSGRTSALNDRSNTSKSLYSATSYLSLVDSKRDLYISRWMEEDQKAAKEKEDFNNTARFRPKPNKYRSFK